jgi:transcriptional regulator with GAF, ATPase, and Fis domain
VQAAVTEIDGADYAGVMLLVKDGVSTEASTTELVERIDAAQCDAGDGPCLTSLRDELTVRSDDLRHDSRWPKFGAAAADFGIHSMLALQLFVDGDNLGALNLYSEQSNSFNDADENVGLLLASHAAVAVVDARKIDHLRIALDSRDLIGQAKGILMERLKVNASQAFGMLVAISQHTHRKVNAIAEQLATTGELPELHE